MSDSVDGTVRFRNEYETSDNSFELVEVEDKERKQTHHLLIELKSSKLGTKVSGESNVTSASISLDVHYIYGSRIDLIGEFVSCMGASICGFDKSTRLTNGSVMIRIECLKGIHIGTYLFYKIVNWAKINAPGYRIIPISLSSVDAGEKNRDRRNSFYENFGLRFEYLTENGVEKACGRSLATMTTDDLIPYQNWPNITVRHVHGGLRRLAHDIVRMRRSLADSTRRLREHGKRRRNKEGMLHLLAMCINWPMYFLFIVIGFTAGRYLGQG
jgi:hypothetical protein